MKTGDTVRDPAGRSYQVGQLLGRGLWGRTYVARDDASGVEVVLKVPHGLDAFTADGEDLARICREIGLEQGRLLEAANGGGLIRPLARFVTEAGIPVLILPRLPVSLQSRFEGGQPLGELLGHLGLALQAVRALPTSLRAHGNLRPANLLLDGRGALVLTDPLTDTLRRHLPALARARGLGLSWLPPEARARPDLGNDAGADTYALAGLLLRAALQPLDAPAPPLAEEGLDKAALVALKDGVRNRLASEPSNPRFHARFAERLSALLNRALSREASPSPPYRFPKLEEFEQRIDELRSLFSPAVRQVGRLLLDRPPGQTAFRTDEELRFSCTAACGPGVDTHEDIACGLAVFDLLNDRRLRDLPCSYTVDRHPSGRFRFGFTVAPLPPGHYRVRLAFTIRDGGHEPQTAETELQVEAAPGYVPPGEDPAPKPIRFASRPEPEPVTEVGAVPAPRPSERSIAAAVQAEEARMEAARVEAARVEAARAEAGRPEAPRSPPPGSSEEPMVRPRPLPPETSPPTVEPRPRPRIVTAEPEPPAEPEYRGAGRWTELPLPGLGGPSPIGPDPTEFEETEPLPPPTAGPLDRLLKLVDGEGYRIFIGVAVAVILLLVLALVWLR